MFEIVCVKRYDFGLIRGCNIGRFVHIVYALTSLGLESCIIMMHWLMYITSVYYIHKEMKYTDAQIFYLSVISFNLKNCTTNRHLNVALFVHGINISNSS